MGHFFHAAGWSCFVIFVLMFTAMPGRASSPDETSLACSALTELHNHLEGLGYTIDAELSAKATTLALAQTVDVQARFIDTDAWNLLQEKRRGLAWLPGFRLTMTNGFPVLIHVTTNSPAQQAGMKAGDVIIGVNTQPIEKLSLPEAIRLFTGVTDSVVTINYVRDQQTNQVVITPARLQQEAIEVAEALPNNIGYMKINGLFSGCGRDIISRIRAWSETNRDGIILDLRDASGDDTDAIVQVASLFAQDGQFLFAYRDFNQQDLHNVRATAGGAIQRPTMVLINRNTTGAAEVLAAVIHAISRDAMLIGETTAGDFLLRDVVPLADRQLLMAVRLLDTADGRRYTGQSGIAPALQLTGVQHQTHDYEPPVDMLDRRTKLDVEERDRAIRRRVRGDGVLERAIDLIIGLKSLNKETGQVSSTDSPP